MRTSVGRSLLALLGQGLLCDRALAETGGDPVRFDLWQAGFTIAVFVVLVLILSRTAFKPILRGLQKREEFIRESLAEAKRIREASEAWLKEYDERLRQARKDASAIVEEGRRDAEALRRRIEEETRQFSVEMSERVKRDIGIARDTALKELYDRTADLATSLAAAVLSRQLSPEEHERLMREALSELEKQTGSPN